MRATRPEWPRSSLPRRGLRPLLGRSSRGHSGLVSLMTSDPFSVLNPDWLQSQSGLKTRQGRLERRRGSKPFGFSASFGGLPTTDGGRPVPTEQASGGKFPAESAEWRQRVRR